MAPGSQSRALWAAQVIEPHAQPNGADQIPSSSRGLGGLPLGGRAASARVRQGQPRHGPPVRPKCASTPQHSCRPAQRLTLPTFPARAGCSQPRSGCGPGCAAGRGLSWREPGVDWLADADERKAAQGSSGARAGASVTSPRSPAAQIEEPGHSCVFRTPCRRLCATMTPACQPCRPTVRILVDRRRARARPASRTHLTPIPKSHPRVHNRAVRAPTRSFPAHSAALRPELSDQGCAPNANAAVAAP
jgi:hypothetical protein